jgi:hypothetical protein
VPRNTIETIFADDETIFTPFGLNALRRSGRPRSDGCRMAAPDHNPWKGRSMQECAQCHGKLGLGARARNLWNGRCWWFHIRFCSAHCEAEYMERYDANGPRWHTFLARNSKPN